MSVWNICPMCGGENVEQITTQNNWKCKDCDFEFKKGYVYYSKIDDCEKWGTI